MADAIDHENLARADGKLDLLLPLGGSKLDALKISSFLTANPFNTLKLRVNKERITLARDNDSSIFGGDSVSRESFSGPESLLGRS